MHRPYLSNNYRVKNISSSAINGLSHSVILPLVNNKSTETNILVVMIYSNLIKLICFFHGFVSGISQTKETDTTHI